ncbi:MAG: ribosome maturation factor RimP [Clostridiales bacterium]|nr:ribosome maturation factor RimP [Clostridiales bacterium]
MAKSELTAVVEPRCQRLAEELGYELVDVALDKEDSGKYLRLYIDKPEGITLDDCERYHRAIQPQLESYDYDFLEVSSPGVDRPLKKDRDFERALGLEVELHLFKAIEGQKVFTGELAGYDKDEVVLLIAGEEKRFGRRAASLIKPVVDLDGIQDVDLGEGADEMNVGDEIEVEEVPEE